MNKIPILALTSAEYASAVKSALGKGVEHAQYIYQEWYRQGRVIADHPMFRNAIELKEAIIAATEWEGLAVSCTKSDGLTEKRLLKTQEGFEVESVVIPMQAGGTLCISSQVGCRMGCRFCETGRMGLLKNLTAAEIVSQVFNALHGDKPASIRNVVFMGMGEPFDNYDPVMQAFRVINDPLGLNIGCKRITISTSGRTGEILRFAQEKSAPNLAVSITAANDPLRDRLMPINRKHSLQELKLAMQAYNTITGRSILAAYVLIKGENDTLDHAEELARYLEGLNVKINLIPYNAQTHDRYASPDKSQVAAFKQYLTEKGYQVLLRTTKGDQIMAACGQLGKKQQIFAVQKAIGI